MELLVFAHRGEAGALLNSYTFESLEVRGVSKLYRETEGERLLLICGEGLWRASNQTTIVLSQFPSITSITNMGVAGAFPDSKLKKNQVISIRTVYGEKQFHSYNSTESKSSVDCISSFERALSETSNTTLAPFASMVDRELWGIAQAAKSFNIPFKAYKIVSDIIGTGANCFDIQNQAMEYSKKLLAFYISNQETVTLANKTKVTNLPKGFYFTDSQERLFTQTLNRIEHKTGLTRSKILKACSVNEIKTSRMTDKRKTQKLLIELQKFLTPEISEVEAELLEKTKSLRSTKTQVSFPKKLESAEVKLTAKLENQDDVNQLSQKLSHFSWKELESLYDGSKNAF